jgi:hypothetical protein
LYNKFFLAIAGPAKRGKSYLMNEIALQGVMSGLNVAYFSMMAVLKPSWAQRIADTYPPGPEPIMTTSNELIVMSLLFVFYFLVTKLQFLFDFLLNIES